MAQSSKDVGFILTWKIKNFSLCHQRDEDYLISPLFRIEMLGNSEWELRLYPRKNNAVIVKLFRTQNDKGPQKVQLNLELSLLIKNCHSLHIEHYGRVVERYNLLTQPLSVSINKIFKEKKLFLPEDTLTVQCRLWNQTTKNLVKCFAVTQISMEKYQISLPVCYISDIFFSTNEIFLNSVSKKYPELKIYWIKQNENADFTVHNIQPSFRVFVRCEVSIQQLNCSKNMLFEGDHWYETGPANKVWTLTNIFQSVISDMKRSGNKSYKLDINLFASDASYNSYIESIAHCSAIPESKGMIHASSEYILPKQIETIYLEEKFSDFTIKSGKKEFKIHKTIFGAVSPVFAAMFELNMAEKEESTVTIDDIESNTLEKLIHYVYTGNIIDVEWDGALSLYAAADKYQITNLKQSCVRILTSKMDTENVTDALILADLHQDKTVISAAKHLIRKNVTQVSGSEKWNSFMKNYPKIACTIMYELWINSSESS